MWGAALHALPCWIASSNTGLYAATAHNKCSSGSATLLLKYHSIQRDCRTFHQAYKMQECSEEGQKGILPANIMWSKSIDCMMSVGGPQTNREYATSLYKTSHGKGNGGSHPWPSSSWKASINILIRPSSLWNTIILVIYDRFTEEGCGPKTFNSGSFKFWTLASVGTSALLCHQFSRLLEMMDY